MKISTEVCHRDGGVYTPELDVSCFVQAVNVSSAEARVVQLDVPTARGLSEDWAIYDSDAGFVLDDNLFPENTITFEAEVEVLGDTIPLRDKAVKVVDGIAGTFGGKKTQHFTLTKPNKEDKFTSRITYEFGKAGNFN